MSLENVEPKKICTTDFTKVKKDEIIALVRCLTSDFVKSGIQYFIGHAPCAKMDSKLDVILITLRGLAVDIIIAKETTETLTTEKRWNHISFAYEAKDDPATWVVEHVCLLYTRIRLTGNCVRIEKGVQPCTMWPRTVWIWLGNTKGTARC